MNKDSMSGNHKSVSSNTICNIYLKHHVMLSHAMFILNML